MNKKTIIVLSVVIIVLLAGVFVYMTYNKPHKSVNDVDFSMDATLLVAEFEQDEAAANTKYLDKVVEVKGTVKEVMKSDSSITLLLGEADAMSSVSCSLSAGAAKDAGDVKAGDEVTIRGICSGMLLDVALANCEIVK